MLVFLVKTVRLFCLAGKLAMARLWYERAEGKFITSTYYMKQPPAWLLAWNNKRFPDQFFGKEWIPVESGREAL